jgi:CHAT domain-containing protein
LPSAWAEVRFLENLLPGSEVLIEAGATREAVLASLPQHRIAHLSCHGLTDRGRPASSRLLLYDHSNSPLTVTSLSRLRLTDAELAFLSACSTSDTSRHLLDEPVHITAAFQLAGYQNVIGTLWPVIDDVAAQVTRDFYTRLTNNNVRLPQTTIAAQALHEAIRGLRERYPDDPVAWAGFVHAGR